MIDENAFEAGYRAGEAYKSKHSNPYEGQPLSDELRAMDWYDGWRHGMADAGNEVY